jgi:hypothetical protein
MRVLVSTPENPVTEMSRDELMPYVLNTIYSFIPIEIDVGSIIKVLLVSSVFSSRVSAFFEKAGSEFIEHKITHALSIIYNILLSL